MKTLVIGDVHTKFKQILTDINSCVAKFQPNEIVFVGDYCDEWGRSAQDNIECLELFANWCKTITSKGIKVVTLIGNHDICYIIDGYYCSGHHSELEAQTKEMLLNNFELQLCYCSQNILFSHAGILGDWARRYLPHRYLVRPRKIANTLNNWFGDLLGKAQWQDGNNISAVYENRFPRVLSDGLFDCGVCRMGSSMYSGPLWADQIEHLNEHNDCAQLEFTQVAGHSPVPSITYKGNICLCDTWSLYSDGAPIGDNSFCLVQDGKIYKLVNGKKHLI